MAHLNFVIPGHKNELLTENDDYYVKDTLGPKDLVLKLKAAKTQLREEGAEFIIDCFDTYYSVLHNGDTVSMDVMYKAYEDLHKGANELNKSLGFLLEDKESLNDEIKVKYCNIMKMLLYVYTQVILLIEQKTETKNQAIGVKGKKKTRDNDGDYCLDKNNILLVLNHIMQWDICLFWDPPVVEENFIGMVSEICYRFLQNPSVKANKELRLEIFNLIGTLIKNYNHGTTFIIRTVQLIKMHEHLVQCLPEGVQKLVLNFNCKGLVHDLVREITEWQTEERFQDSQGARFCAKVLSEMAILMPDLLIPELIYLNRYLGYDSATLRNSVLNVITEVILNVLTNHELSEEERESRDEFFIILMDHINDITAQVRSKVIQHFARLQIENAIPIDKQYDIIEKVIFHLRDKGALVRRSAINCVTTFLSHNAFSANLSLSKMEAELEINQKELHELKQKFEGVKMATLEKIEEDWNSKKEELKKAIEEELELDDDENKENDDQSQIPKEEIPDLIRLYLSENKFRDAFKLCKYAGKNNEDFQQLKEDEENDEVDMYLLILRSIFINIGNLVENLKNAIIQGSVKMSKEDFKKLETLEANAEYLNDSVKFLKLIDSCIPVMIELLETTTIGDMQEAVDFFITAYQFNIDNAQVGVLAMLRIMQRNEQERKDTIVDAFKTIYLNTDSKNMTEHTTTIVNRLISLLKSVPVNNEDDLQQIISDWTVKGTLDNSVIDVFWQYFTKKMSVTDDDSRAAAELLRMAALGRRTIITKNIKLVTTIGFKERGANNMLFLGSCCDLLAVAGREKLDVNSKNPPFKIKCNDEVFNDLTEILVEKFFEPVEYYYKAISGGIDFIYKLCSKPERTCEIIISRVMERLVKDIKGTEEVELHAHIIVRICQLLGFVAIKHLEYLDDTVYKELKRRNNIRDERKENKRSTKGSKTKDKNRSRIKSLSNTANESVLNSTTTSVLEESTLEGAQAEDTDAEFILNVLENDTVCGSGGLGKLAYIVRNICQRPDVYDDVMIQGAAVIALIRFMLVSSRFCEDNIQLLFTIFEKTTYPEVKCTILVHLSDLLTRFPNIIEPWTPRIYKRLKDPDYSIRKATFFTLSNLILRDMIRAHSHISEMVCCLVDEDKELSGMCKTFFVNLSHKENNLYNVLPDIFSHLMEISDMSEEDIKGTMKFLFNLMDKTKHMENLVERFCTKYRLTEDLKQHQYITYCLTLINYNEKALKKLQENFHTYKHLVHDPDIYASFKNILQNAGKQQVGKTDLKPIINEIEQSINSVFELNEDGQMMKPPPVPKSTRKPRSKRTPAKNKPKRRKHSFADSDSDE